MSGCCCCAPPGPGAGAAAAAAAPPGTRDMSALRAPSSESVSCSAAAATALVQRAEQKFGSIREAFLSVDTNGNGYVERSELEAVSPTTLLCLLLLMLLWVARAASNDSVWRGV